jgi:CubicO group peptidase (beta-lactamase class C family)
MNLPVSIVLAMSWTLLVCPACAASAAAPQAAKTSEMDRVIEEAIKNGDCPGAVVLIGHKGETVYRKAYGYRALKPEKEAMTADTIFDLASLTKPIATATCVMLLIERGKVQLDDPVAKHMPEFGTEGKEKITVEDLLRHRGGLIADNHLRDYADGANQAWSNICNLKPVAAPGEKFIYSDVGFIVLGQLVERVEGKRLKHMASESVFEPLGMKDTMFSPPPPLWKRCAPTQQRDGQWLRGVVHDPRAWALEGNAGHAGLFGTADDLARYAWMLLRGGELNGKRVLAAETVRQMIRGKPLAEGKNTRALGWDVDTAYSSPRGDHFQRGVSFGHTGFTGTSIWLDPASDSFVILLTNRVHPDGKGNTVALRRRVATLAAEALGAR